MHITNMEKKMTEDRERQEDQEDQDSNMPPKGQLMEIRVFKDTSGRKITGYYPIGEADEKKAEFVGSVTIGDPRTGMAQVPFEFELGLTLQECYDAFDDKLKEEVQRIKDASLIATPQQMGMSPRNPNLTILGPKE